MDTIKVILETQGSNSAVWTDWLKELVPLVSALAGVLIGGRLNNKITLKTLKSKANEPEIQEIRDSLKTFYQPLLLSCCEKISS